MDLDARLTLTVPATKQAAAMARQAVRTLSPKICEDNVANVTLLASEVVANGVRHAESDAYSGITLELFLFSDRVRVEVRDRGDGFAPPPAPEPSEERDSGWGLFLVDRLSERWGVEETASRVWFEVARAC